MSQSNQRRVPEGLRDIMRSLTKEILQEKPSDIYEFSQKYFESILQRKKKIEEETYESIENHKINNDGLKISKIPPLYLVFAIIPDEISKLIREFIKAVLRENPTNIYKFAVKYFKRLQNVGGITEYTTYENYMERKVLFSLAPYVKCTCGRMVGSQLDTEYAYSNISHIVDMKGEKYSSSVAFENKGQNPAVSIKQQNNALYHLTEAACVLQRFFRLILKRKTLTTPQENIAKDLDHSIKNRTALSQQSAAFIIQKALRKLCEDRGKQRSNSALEYMKQNKNSNEYISDAASYTSASTALMSADSAYEKVHCVDGDFAEKADSTNVNTYLSENTNMRENHHYIPENSNYSTKKDIGHAESEQNEYEFTKFVANDVNIDPNPKTNYELQTEIDALNQKYTLLSTVNAEYVLETAKQTTTDTYIEENMNNMDLYLKNLNMTPEINIKDLNDHNLEEFVPRNKEGKETIQIQSTTNQEENEIDRSEYEISLSDNFVSDVQNNATGFLESDTKDIKNLEINKEIQTETPHKNKPYIESNITSNSRSRSPDNSADPFHLKQSIGVLSPDDEMLVFNTSLPSNALNYDVQNPQGQQHIVDDLFHIQKNNKAVVSNVDMSVISENSGTANPTNVLKNDSVICNLNLADIQSKSNHEPQIISKLPCQKYQFTESKHMQIEKAPSDNLCNNTTETENKKDSNGMQKNMPDDKSIILRPESELKVMLGKRASVAEIVLNDAVFAELNKEENLVPESNNKLISNTDIKKSLVDDRNLETKLKVGEKFPETSDNFVFKTLNDTENIAIACNIINGINGFKEDSCIENREVFSNSKCLKDNFVSESKTRTFPNENIIKLSTNILSDVDFRTESLNTNIAGAVDINSLNEKAMEDFNNRQEEILEANAKKDKFKLINSNSNNLLEDNASNINPKLNQKNLVDIFVEDNNNESILPKNEMKSEWTSHDTNNKCDEISGYQDTLMHISVDNETISENNTLSEVLKLSSDQLLQFQNESVNFKEENEDSPLECTKDENLFSQQQTQDEIKKTSTDTPSNSGLSSTQNLYPKSTGLQKITEEIDSLPLVETIGTQYFIINKQDNINIEKCIHTRNNIQHFENNHISQIESIPKILTADKFLKSIQDIHSNCEITSNQEPYFFLKNNKDGDSCWELDNSDYSEDFNEQAFEEDSLEVESSKETDIEEDSLETSFNTKNIQAPNKLYTDIERTPTYLYGVSSPKHTQIFRRNSSKISTAFTIPFDNKSKNECRKLTKKASKAADILESSSMCRELNSPDKILDTEITNNDKCIKNDTEEVQLSLQPSTKLLTKINILQDGNDSVDLPSTDVEANLFQIDIVSSICGEGIEEKFVQHSDKNIKKDQIDDYGSIPEFETTLLTIVEGKESQTLRLDNNHNKTTNDIKKGIIRSDIDYNIKDVSSGYNDLLIEGTSSNELKEFSDNSIILNGTVNKDSIPISFEKIEEEISQPSISLDESLKNNVNANFTRPIDKFHTNVPKFELNDKIKSNIYSVSTLNSKENVVKTVSEKAILKNTDVSPLDKKEYNAAKKIQTFFRDIMKKNLNSNETNKLVFDNTNHEKQYLGNSFQDKLSDDAKIIGNQSNMHNESDHLKIAGSLITEIINSAVQQARVQKPNPQQKYLVHIYNRRDINDLPIENKKNFIKAAIKIQEAFRKYKYENKYKPFNDYANEDIIINCTKKTPIRNVENFDLAAIKIQHAFRKYLAKKDIYPYSDSTLVYSPNNLTRNTQIIKEPAAHNGNDIVEDVATDVNIENESVIIRQILSTAQENEHCNNFCTNHENRTTLTEPLESSLKVNWFVGNEPITTTAMSENCNDIDNLVSIDINQLKKSGSQNDISSPFASSNCSFQPILSDKTSMVARPSRKNESNLFSTGKQNNDSYVNEIVSATKTEESPDDVREFSNIIKTNILQTEFIENDSRGINYDEANISDFNQINGYITTKNLEDNTDMYSKIQPVSIKDRNAINNGVIQNIELPQDAKLVHVASKINIEKDNFNIGAIVSDFINMEKRCHMDEVEIQSLLHATIMQETCTKESQVKPHFTGTGAVGLNISEDDIPTLSNNINKTLTSNNYLCSEDIEPTETGLSNSKSERCFEEPLINFKLDLHGTHQLEDTEFVLNRLQKEDTRESSAQSESVVLNCVYEINGNEAHTKTDVVRPLYKSVTIDDIVKYIDPVENDTKIDSSFYLDEDTSETIRRKILAYSVSEGDSDDYEKSVDILGISMDNIQNNQKNDFNISTALNDTTETSTETESTIVSAATKIQAGARGFLTRQRLRRASAGTKSSTQAQNKASFGNDAINESLEKLIAEEAAKKIQCAYRAHSHRRRNCPTSYRSTSSLEKSLAARRSTLQRGDALRNYSTPDEDNNGNVNDKRLQAETLIPSMLPRATSSNSSNDVYHKETATATIDSGKNIIDNKLKWLVMRQNSMPVQIDSDLLRVIPKHMRKRIKSADGVNKRRPKILKD